MIDSAPPARRLVAAALVAVAIACLTLASPHTSAQDSTYYVDAAHPQADDAGPGSAEQPWARCPGMPGWEGTARLEPGDTVYFRGGTRWNVSDGMAGLQVRGGVTYDGSAWGSGERATLRATGPIARSLVSFMEDHPSLPTVVRGFELDANGQVTTGAGFNWPHMQADLVGATKRIEDCVIHDVHSVQADGQYEYGIVVSSWLGYRIGNVEVLDCEVYNISRAGICNYLGNDQPDNRSHNVVFRGNEVHHTGLDTTGSSGSGIALKNHAVDAVVERNSIHDTIIGINVTTHPAPGFRGPERAVIRHNILRDSGHVGLWFANGGDKSVDVYGNLVINSRYEGLRVASSVADGLSLRIHNNTFYHNYRQQWSHDVRIEGNDSDVHALEFVNNLIYSADTTRSLGDDDGDLTLHHHNLYYRDGGGTVVTAGGQAYSAGDVAEWEPSAVAAAPRLRDPGDLPLRFVGLPGVDSRPDRHGLSLGPDSPALDSGAPLSSPFDTSINSVGRPAGPGWDIGAYEMLVGPTAEPGATATRTATTTATPTWTATATDALTAVPTPTAQPSPTVPADCHLHLPFAHSVAPAH